MNYADIHRTAPVSPIQEMIIRLHDNGELHLSVYVYELKGLVDESALRRAVEALTVNHPILRATWAKSNSGYCQVLLPTTAVSFSSFDGCILNHIQQTKAVILTPRQRNVRFSLIRDKPRGTTFLTIALHHAICDAFTRYLLERDLVRALGAPMIFFNVAHHSLGTAISRNI
ncbi:hypothetical protein AFLA70_323g001171 [Aspergillus flavus AF70]|nr:hypothetical protein AFLA70_323g001171 [Aspergillus flavus AF70]